MDGEWWERTRPPCHRSEPQFPSHVRWRKWQCLLPKVIMGARMGSPCEAPAVDSGT